MRPWLANFEQQIKAALLVTSPVPGTRYLVEFDSADLLRATPTERVMPRMRKGLRAGSRIRTRLANARACRRVKVVMSSAGMETDWWKLKGEKMSEARVTPDEVRAHLRL